MSLRIIPVIDLMNGVVVRGIAGRRDQYRPITSQLTSSARPLDVASALIERFHPEEIYLADLDAIRGNSRNRAVFAELCLVSKPIWVDAGIRNLEQAEELTKAGCNSIILGLETIPNPQILEAITTRLGTKRLIFSLDLKEGQLLGESLAWKVRDDNPLAIIEKVVALGIRRIIVLDLAQVGMNAGSGTEELCRGIAAKYPNVEVITGGGIRDAEDLRRLQDCGVRGALVASALHDGRIQPDDWPPQD